MQNPALAEFSLFLVLLCLSVFFFFRRFSPILRTILRSRKDSDFQFYPIGKRVRNFIWEVMLQGKVIKERPLPGLAHAFVFWGFCAFALVTFDHLAAGFGADFISHDGVIGQVYFFFAAMFAIAVAVSIVGLLIRRFVVRPLWLGPVSLESGVIGLLIFILMITYLAVFWLPEGTAAGRANWWAHTLALLVFLPLVPHTKHLHLMLSPVTIFLSRGSFSKIPPLQGDDDFGIETGKDITNLVALQAFSCVECGRCSQHCPATRTGKVLDPKKIALGVRDYLKDHGAGGEEPLVGKYISQEALFQCTTCGACEYQCPVGIEHVPIIVGLRRGLVNTGKWEDEYGGKLFLNLERNGNAMGFAPSERDKFLQKNEIPIFDGSQYYCLWLGCMGSYDPHGREIIGALTEVMRFLNVTFGVLKREKCTGDPVRRLGNDYLLTELAESNLEQIRSSKVTRMLSICPHCVRTIGQDWREAGATVEIEHHSEFLARNVARLPADPARQARVVFHDPCYLGRYRGIYDEPRQVIDRSMPMVETPLSRERGFCCGAGGGRVFLGEEKGKRVNVERAEALAASGAPTIGAACPFCQTMLRDGLTQISGEPPKLVDIAQIAAASLPK